MSICPNCGKSTPDGKFCEHCGGVLPLYQPPVTPPAPIAERTKKSGIGIGVGLFVFVVILLGIFYVIGTLPTDTLIIPTSGGPWSGTWDSNWGVMTLSQSGNQVTGTYVYRNGLISGVVSGNTLTGTWSESPTYQAPQQAGDVILKLSDDKKSLTGEWRYGSSGSWSGDWKGTKLY